MSVSVGVSVREKIFCAHVHIDLFTEGVSEQCKNLSHTDNSHSH